jgi:hypothetical protein
VLIVPSFCVLLLLRYSLICSFADWFFLSLATPKIYYDLIILDFFSYLAVCLDSSVYFAVSYPLACN